MCSVVRIFVHRGITAGMNVPISASSKEFAVLFKAEQCFRGIIQ